MENKRNIRPISPFVGFCQKVIPLAYDESMSYYECLCALLNHIMEVDEAVNLNADAVTELQNYVKNYFDNLDVQDEINNKLDEMSESGVLEEIIAEYLKVQALFCFDNIDDLKEATNLIDGSYAKTLGYYSKNDGGGAVYKVRTVTNQDVVNDMDIIALNNTNLVAEFVRQDILNIKQFGCLGDNVYDNTIKLQKCIDYAYGDGTNKIEVFIPSGKYVSSYVEIYGGLKVYGENKNNSILISKNDINYDNFVTISGAYTELCNISIIGTSNGAYDSTQHVQNGLSFGTTKQSYAYRLHIHDIEVSKHTGNGISRTSHIDGYLADSIFENLFVAYNEQHGLNLTNNSDFKILNSYFATNRYNGVNIACSNIQISNCKSYLNGVGVYNASVTKQTRYDGFRVNSLGLIMSDCTAQENYGHGFHFINVQSGSVSNCTSDANGILGFTENPYDLQHHGSQRVSRTSSIETNHYSAYGFENCTRSLFNGLNCLSFINISTYGRQMDYLFYFISGNSSNTIIGRGVVQDTTLINENTFTDDDVIILNNKLYGTYNKLINKSQTVTVSNVVTGNSGSFHLDVPKWVTFVAFIKIGRGNSVYDSIVVCGGNTTSQSVVNKVSQQSYYTITTDSTGATINIGSGGIYSASITAINL